MSKEAISCPVMGLLFITTMAAMHRCHLFNIAQSPSDPNRGWENAAWLEVAAGRLSSGEASYKNQSISYTGTEGRQAMAVDLQGYVAAAFEPFLFSPGGRLDTGHELFGSRYSSGNLYIRKRRTSNTAAPRGISGQGSRNGIASFGILKNNVVFG